MSTLFYGSVCLTDLIEYAKKKHSAFSKAQNGKIYVNVNCWLNDEVNKFGHIMSLQLNPTKDKKDSDDKAYIGNFKQSEGAKPISDRDSDSLNIDLDIPVNHNVKSDIPQSPETTDLPF